jgi:phosphohistidine phosphatase SixA
MHPMIKPLSLLFGLVVLMAGPHPAAGQQSGTTTVILVRHAEKADMPVDNPPLIHEGQERAKALATLAKDAGVTAILTTQYARTRETAEPAAAALHITPEVVRAGGASAAQHVQEVARKILNEHRGQVVLVVEHSNTIPAIVAALGAPEPMAICDSQYDLVYTVVVPAGSAATVTRSRYGEPSPAGAGCATMKAP